MCKEEFMDLKTKNRFKVLWITQTAVFIAMMLVVQAYSKPLGQYVTGSAVNLILILSVMLGGLYSGMAVSVLSPVLAFLLGFGHALPLILPFVMLGNLSLVLVWYFITAKIPAKVSYFVALTAGAVVKTMVLYFGIVKIMVPLLNLPDAQASLLSLSFSFPQLITAAIGGLISIMILPTLKSVLKIQSKN